MCTNRICYVPQTLLLDVKGWHCQTTRLVYMTKIIMHNMMKPSIGMLNSVYNSMKYISKLARTELFVLV